MSEISVRALRAAEAFRHLRLDGPDNRLRGFSRLSDEHQAAAIPTLAERPRV